MTEASAATGPHVIAAYLRQLPDAPGVYRMLGADGEVLYVGKARNLAKRVASYAQGRYHTQRIARMVALTGSMEFVVTASETEALLLEANLIKQLKPRFNVSYRDDKSFPSILVREDHPTPQLVKHRGARSVKGHYFGPFASAGAVNRTLNTLQRAFLLRSCSDSVLTTRTRPCLLHQIRRCSAPCTGRIAPADYAALVQEAVDFLEGKSRAVQGALEQEMDAAAQRLDFEKAAQIRDRIRALAHVQQHQGVNPRTVQEADLFAIHEAGGASCIQVFFFRLGQNWGNRAYFPRHEKSFEAPEVLEAFLAQFYDDKDPPRSILLSHDVSGRALLAEALSVRAGHAVEVLVPQRGEKRDLVEHALHNAREALARRLSESASQRALLEACADTFGLEAPPRRIEVYDNSHIQGTNAVGAMIVAGADGFQKAQYRKFNIAPGELAPGDDFAMMRQVLTRRFARLMKENPDRDADDDAQTRAAQWPDLVLIDGGEGQLSAACGVLRELGVENVAIAAISKGPDRNAGREQFHVPGRPAFMLEAKTPLLHFLQRLRDEAHRFAIGAHRTRRAKEVSASALDEIAGIGAARKRALIRHFGSARAVERATLADLESVEGVSAALARRIYDHFRTGSS